MNVVVTQGIETHNSAQWTMLIGSHLRIFFLTCLRRGAVKSFFVKIHNLLRLNHKLGLPQTRASHSSQVRHLRVSQGHTPTKCDKLKVNSEPQTALNCFSLLTNVWSLTFHSFICQIKAIKLYSGFIDLFNSILKLVIMLCTY